MTDESILTRISEGMEVFDSEGARVGIVEAIWIGKDETSVDIVTMANELVAFDSLMVFGNFAIILIERCYEQGFIRVNRGLLRRDALIFPEQIKGVVDNDVYLNVEKEMVIKL